MYYLPLLIISILFNYSIGSYIERTRLKSALIAGISTNLMLLGYYKYMGFFMSSCNALLLADLPVPEIILPLGISFFTFTQTAYLVDAYRGETKKYTLLTYSLFVTVFPHLIAGPILNHREMIPQFSRLRNFVFSHKNMALGITMFSMGLFKKVVIADTLSPWVKLAFDHAEQLSFVEAWLGAVSYTLQLYFDFSGYSEMAVGLGLMFNFNLPINFNSPYKSTSIIDFWRRWHISLSTFLKNYLYIPIGGNRNGNHLRNILITMLLGGLWHGAGWTFIIWGGLHGLYLVINHTWRKQSIRLPKMVNWLITFLCVVVAWVFFRADNVQEALSVLMAMVNLGNIVLPSGGFYEAKLGLLRQFGVHFDHISNYANLDGLAGKVVAIVGLLTYVVWARNTQEWLTRFSPNWVWAGILAMGVFYALILMNNTTSEFLYFQF